MIILVYLFCGNFCFSDCNSVVENWFCFGFNSLSSGGSGCDFVSVHEGLMVGCVVAEQAALL